MSSLSSIAMNESQIIGGIFPKIVAPSEDEFRDVPSFIQRLLEDEEFNQKGIAKVWSFCENALNFG